MTINTRFDADEQKLVVALTGRLDSNTADQLSKELTTHLDNLEHDLVLDLAELKYISSAGLRVVFMTHKKCKTLKKHFTVANASPAVQEIFDMTGYSGI